ncbi:MAG: hypothetical protein JSR77_03555 [Planctomycetes bacterium]|nr:hypothetical protein [Planctomycetota bacterium]
MRRFARGVARVVLLCGIAGLAAWIVGRVINDAWWWSQFLYWIPSHLAIAGALVCLFIGWLGEVLTPPQERSRWPGRMLMALLAIVLVRSCYEWRVDRYVRPAVAAQERAIRVLAWNPAVDFMDDFAVRVAHVQPQVVTIANRPAYTQWEAIRTAVGGQGSMIRYGRLSLVSRFRVIRWGGTSLGVKGAKERMNTWKGGGELTVDRGEALFVELDTREDLGKTTVMWVVDMPSDLNIGRADMFAQAAAVVTGFRGPAYTRNRAELDEEEPACNGFPKPDLVVGDFNTPRGSRSIRTLVGDMRHAYDDAGRGMALSWPRRLPTVPIDQAYLGESLRAVGYEVRDLWAGDHKAQVIDLVAAKPAGAK